MIEIPFNGTHNGACIYGFLNTKENKWYIGQTIDFCGRKRNHLRANDTPFHQLLQLSRDIFKIYIIEKPDEQTLSNITNLSIWLDEREQYHISKYNSFENGYNLTKGGKCSKIDIQNFKKIKSALETFEIHKIAVKWFCERETSLSRCPRDFIITGSNDDKIENIKLGQIIHKWRQNRNSYILLKPENLEFLNSYGFDNSNKGRNCRQPKQWLKWKCCMLWVYERYGHINMIQTYIMPNESPYPDEKFGVFITSMRTKSDFTHFHKSIQKTFTLCGFKQSQELFITFQLQQAMKYYLKEFCKFKKVPQSFKFPQSHHVLYLQNYAFGHNFRNMMKRKNDENTVEARRYEILRRDIIRFLILTYVKSENKSYDRGNDIVAKSNTSATLRSMFESKALQQANEIIEWSRQHDSQVPRNFQKKRNKTEEEILEATYSRFVSNVKKSTQTQGVCFSSVVSKFDQMWGENWK